jgi:GTPase SAR1 family protein
MDSPRKVVLVGNKQSGKTSLYNCISGEKFNIEYEPTLNDEFEESCQKNISINGQKVKKILFLTSNECIRKLLNSFIFEIIFHRFDCGTLLAEKTAVSIPRKSQKL